MAGEVCWGASSRNPLGGEEDTAAAAAADRKAGPPEPGVMGAGQCEPRSGQDGSGSGRLHWDPLTVSAEQSFTPRAAGA